MHGLGETHCILSRSSLPAPPHPSPMLPANRPPPTTSGAERTNIMYSTGHMLRQCKASIFEGGIRVPGILHLPANIDPAIRPSGNINVTTPIGALDVLPTIMELLNVDFKTASKNPSWVLDGLSMLAHVRPGSDPDGPRPAPLPFSTGPSFNNSQQAVIDNDWKIILNPEVGQCDLQPGFNFTAAKANKNKRYLFNLKNDVHETVDLSELEPGQFARMSKLLDKMRASITVSREEEVKCLASCGSKC